MEKSIPAWQINSVAPSRSGEHPLSLFAPPSLNTKREKRKEGHQIRSSLNPAFRQSYAIAKAISGCTTKEMKRKCILAWCVATKKAINA